AGGPATSEVVAHAIEIVDAENVAEEHAARVVVEGEVVVQDADVPRHHLPEPDELLRVPQRPEHGYHPRGRYDANPIMASQAECPVPVGSAADVQVLVDEADDDRAGVADDVRIRKFDHPDEVLSDQLMSLAVPGGMVDRRGWQQRDPQRVSVAVVAGEGIRGID